MVSGWEVCYCLALSVSAQPQQLNIKPKPSLPFPWRKKPQSEYEKEIPKIDWWTASEYEDWIATQKTELEALIGTGDGWYDGQGVFHEWTQDSVNAQIAEYEKILDEIKSGTLYSKDNDEGIGYAQIPPDGKDIVSVYGANFVRSDGSSFHIGDFATQEELDDAIEKAVSDGQITQEEADTASYQ